MSFEEWDNKFIEDVCDVKGRIGWRGYTVEDLREDGPLVIGATQISIDQRIDLSKPTFISREKYLESPDIFIERNDIIVVKVGNTIGKVAIVNRDLGEACINPNTVLLKRIRCNPQFLYYTLISAEGQHYLKSNSSASAQPALNQATLKKMPFKLPPREIQDKISSILTSLDDKIELNRQTSQTLEAIAQALFKEWFVDFNFPGATGEMQDSELGKIPKGWRVVSFEDELEAERGLSYKGAGLTGAEAMPMHNLNSVYEGGGYKLEGIKYYSGDFKEKHLIKPGELIIANTEQGHKYLLIGFPAIVPALFGDKGIFSHHIYRLKPNRKSYLTSDFLFHLLLQPEIREQVVGFANGTTVNMLKIEGLQKPKFVLPPKELVAKFTEIASNMRLKREESIKQIQTLTQLRDELLPKLMKGEIQL